jgi:molybdopterin-guanine dinucleotide biosynthesis protein A
MGENKALKRFAGSTLVETVIARVRPLAGEMAVISNEPELFSFTGLPVYSDLVPGVGVLGGIHTALAMSRAVYTATPGCDMPFVSPALYRAEIELLETSGADVVIPRSASGLEPLHAVFRTATCLDAVGQAVHSGETRIISWFGRVRVLEISMEEVFKIDPSPYIFNNLNDPREFAAAEQVALSGR